jgi:hypothetical protein
MTISATGTNGASAIFHIAHEIWRMAYLPRGVEVLLPKNDRDQCQDSEE